MKEKTDIDWSKITAREIDVKLAAIIDSYEQHVAALGHRPKRESYIVERIADIANLRRASEEAAHKKSRKRYVRRHLAHQEQDLRLLQMQILTQTLPEVEYRSDKVMTDAGKWRDIIKKNFYPWHILEHAVMQVVGGRITRSLVYDSVACIKGKGLHFGVKRVHRFMRTMPELKWYWKCDMKKFYQSIPHNLVRSSFKRIVKDRKFDYILDRVVLYYHTPIEIRNEIDNERQRIRHIHRRLPKSAYRQLCCE
jgi:hypothetical protein